MNKSLIFDISLLSDKPTGTKETFSFETPTELEGFGNMRFSSGITGIVEIMRLPDGFNVVAKSIETLLNLECVKCLDFFNEKIKIPFAEREFLNDIPRHIDDPADLYLIDKKHLKIDITEMLRQEIILHFPVISVCSTSCKGTCQNCGKNKNKEECNCKIEDHEGNKPFASLKSLLK